MAESAKFFKVYVVILPRGLPRAPQSICTYWRLRTPSDLLLTWPKAQSSLNDSFDLIQCLFSLGFLINMGSLHVTWKMGESSLKT